LEFYRRGFRAMIIQSMGGGGGIVIASQERHDLVVNKGNVKLTQHDNSLIFIGAER